MSSFNQFTETLVPGLYPTTSVLGTRYLNKPKSKPCNMVIKPGQFCYAEESEPRYLPPRWSPHIQPEGQLYFSCESTPRLVTDAYMYSTAVQDKVMRFAGAVAKVMEMKHITLSPSAEVYLSPSDDQEECYYYIADHSSRALSWLEEVDLDQLCIPDVVSESHLRYALADLYWQHVEQFPCHRLDSLSLNVEELIAIFVHGEGDHMTSMNSTFPYVAKECKQFVRVLEAAKQRLDQPPSVCIVARLWSIASRHRLQTHYGQERSRLSRDQLILDLPETQTSRIFAGVSHLLLGIPQVYAEKLQSLFCDEIVFVHPWRDFMSGCREEWQQYLTWSLGLSICNALLLALSPASGVIAALSLACCAITLLASLTLLLRYNDAHRWCADQAASFLIASKDGCSGYRRVALAFSAPRAAFIWAAGIASLQAVVWLPRQTRILVLGALVVLALLACLPWARWTRKMSSVLPRCRRAREAEGIFKV
ncbi:hypothetical protein BV20DRAFT_1123971 [Pilatotrama ljubarskyi]|nr:hypothetical protein BV20DRAFT_1123971 [Pilatotrama ljubarskyi]